jgi:hypothetical protein
MFEVELSEKLVRLKKTKFESKPLIFSREPITKINPGKYSEMFDLVTSVLRKLMPLKRRLYLKNSAF